MVRDNTHEIVILDRKPDDEAILRMVHEYFESAAASYDRFNQSTITRQRFIARMDDLIAHDLRTRGPIDTLLSVGCGTGFRENKIRVGSGGHFTATGVDVSAAMCAEARRAGLEVIQSAWLDADLGDRQFDAGVFLYSLGLVPAVRKKAIGSRNKILVLRQVVRRQGHSTRELGHKLASIPIRERVDFLEQFLSGGGQNQSPTLGSSRQVCRSVLPRPELY